MAESCRITPHVYNSKGEEVESKLYNGLKGLMSIIGKGGRTDVLPLYQKTLDPKFNKTMKDKGASFDENGEVTLYDFWNFTDKGKEIPESVLIQYLNASNNFFKGKERIIYSKKKALDLVEQFNSSEWNKKFTAKLTRVGKDKFTIGIHSMDTKYSKSSIFTSRLNKKLSKLLENWGIAVDTYDLLEDEFTHGYTDFDDIGRLSDGLIHLIKVAKGFSNKALPEEFAHFVVRSMKESPLIIRALNQLRENDVYKDVLGEELAKYTEKYKGNVDLLVEEALGKLLAQKIENTWISKDFMTRVFNMFKKVFSRLDENQIKQITLQCDADLNVLTEDILNGKYKNLQTTNLGQGKLYQAERQATAARTKWDIFYETMLKTNIIFKKRRRELGLSSEEQEDDLLNSQYETIDQLDTVISHPWETNPVINITDKKGHIVDKKTQKEYKIDAATSLITLAVENTKKIMTTVAQLREQIENGTYKGSLNSACAKVRAIMDYIEAYAEIFENFDNLLDTEFADAELDNIPEIDDIRTNLRNSANELKENLETIRNEVLGQKFNRREINTNIKKRDEAYKQPLAIKVFLEGFIQFFPENAILAFGHTITGEIVTLEDMLLYADHDLLGISAWVNSMANTPDVIMRMYDAIVKKQKEEARQECLDIQRTITAAGKKLEKAGWGAREHIWMYERDKDGKLVLDSTGMPVYLKAYNDGKAAIELKKFISNLKTKPITQEESQKILENYIKEHYDIRRGQMIPKASYYPSAAYNKLTPEQKEFYNTFMDCKRRLDKYLPIFTNDSHKAIVVRKNTIQRIFSIIKVGKSEFDAGFIQNLKDWWSDLWYKTDTDVEFGEVTTLSDFSGREVKRVPIYNTFKATDTPLYNYSHNLVANMCMYAQTATNYKAMAKVVETLELGHDIMNYRLTSNNKMISSIRDGKRALKENLYLDAKQTNWSKRLENFLDMQVYGRLKTEKSIPTELFSKFVGMMTTALSAYVGLTNILQGLGQINIEMFANEHFNAKDLIKAKTFYWSHILPTLVDSFQMVKDGELTLFSQDFNIMQDFSRDVRELQNYEKNPLARMTGKGYLYILNHIGEHYMQHITFLAMLNHEKIIDGNNNYISVLDAYEKVPVDKNNTSLGYKLALKKYEGPNGTSQTYKTKDGKTIVTFEQLKARQASKKALGKDIDLYSKTLIKPNEIAEYEWKGRLTRKGAKLNQDMHGIYNDDDKNMLQQKAWGSLLIMYRKHIAPNWMKRFKSEGFDYDLDTMTSGYTRQLPKLFLDFFKTSLKEVTDENGNVSQAKVWAIRTWDKQKKANFMRNMGQLFNWLSINLLLSVLESGWDDDDDDLWEKILLISLYRAKTENAQFEPLALFTKHSILDEWVRLLEQPVVGTNILKNFIELFRLVSDWSVYSHIMEKPSPYAGHTEAYKIYHQCLPIYRQFTQHSNPDQLLKYYRSDVGTSKLGDYVVTSWVES